MSPLQFLNYREFIRERLRAFPQRGRGATLKLSERLGVHITHISQVLRGDRDLTREQAWEASRFFELPEAEAEYLLTLVDIERTTSPAFRQHLEERRDRLRQSVRMSFEPQKPNLPLGLGRGPIPR